MAAALSLLRALGCGGAEIPGPRASSILRGCLVALLAILVTLTSDIGAMIGHPAAWSASRIGPGLLFLLVGFGLAAAWGVRRVARRGLLLDPGGRRPAWGRALGVLCGGALFPAVWPDGWRRGAAGAIASALFGMLLMIGQSRGLASAILPAGPVPSEDLLDDLQGLLSRPARRMSGASSRIAAALDWLRVHAGRSIAAVALFGGLTVAAVEFLGEALPGDARRAIAVFAILVAIEASGILLGYALFRRYLGLMKEPSRHEINADGQ